MWFPSRHPIVNEDVDDIIDVREKIQKEMEEVGMETSVEFKVLCPKCTEISDEHFVTLIECKDPETKDPIFKLDEEKCVHKAADLRPGQYKGTKFGKQLTVFGKKDTFWSFVSK